MGSLEVSTGYKPRPLQAVLHKSLRRFNVLCMHRRFGKTIFSLNELFDRGMTCQLKNPQVAYIAPTYGQAKRVAWDAMKEIVRDIPENLLNINEAELRIDIARPHLRDRVRVMLLGAENPGTIRGIYLDWVILDEFAEMDSIIWSQVIRPALADRNGGAIFISTPKGQNGFFDIFQQAQTQPDWFSAVYKASETNILPLSELEAARAIMSPEEYDQEFECSFSAALVGAYYGKYMQEAEDNLRVTSVPYDPSCPVDTFWDLGVDDTTVIWFGQRVGKEWHFINYYEMSGEGLDHYVKYLQSHKYVYGKHYLPHDANARELGTGKTRVETLDSLGLKTATLEVVEKQNIEDGINAVRMLLPRCWFDAAKCKRGILALKSYERKWDSKNKIYQQKPLHNWASHGADAFRTFGMGVDERAPSAQDKLRYPRHSENNYDLFGGQNEHRRR